MVKSTIGFVLVSILSGFAPIVVTTSAQERKDLHLLREITSRLHSYPQLTIFDSVDPFVEQGQVVLAGWVTMSFKRDEIDRRVRAVTGVDSVDNRIGVLPVSQTDDELRFRIARAIYGHTAFWSYAAMAHPPIHIVVNHGQVTLEGVVRSNVERQLARSLASGFASYEIRNALKTDQEVQLELEKLGQ